MPEYVPGHYQARHVRPNTPSFLSDLSQTEVTILKSGSLFGKPRPANRDPKASLPQFLHPRKAWL